MDSMTGEAETEKRKVASLGKRICQKRNKGEEGRGGQCGHIWASRDVCTQTRGPYKEDPRLERAWGQDHTQKRNQDRQQATADERTQVRAETRGEKRWRQTCKRDPKSAFLYGQGPLESAC